MPPLDRHERRELTYLGGEVAVLCAGAGFGSYWFWLALGAAVLSTSTKGWRRPLALAVFAVAALAAVVGIAQGYGPVAVAGLSAAALAVGYEVRRTLWKTPQEVAEARRRWRRDLSLTCPGCGALAGPIAGTADRYRCDCGRQFAGARHNFR
jgi:hypothetical protein